MEYCETEPSPELRPFVRVLWSLRAQSMGPFAEESIAPDGCTEIILNRADPFRRLDAEGGSHLQAESLLVGPMQRSIAIAATGVVDLIGIRFEPYGLHALLGVPMYELLNRDLDLCQLDRPGVALRSKLAEACGEAALRACAPRIEAVLLTALADRGSKQSAWGLTASSIRLAQRGVLNVDRWSKELGLNRRALERQFRTQIGLSPKLYLRIERLQGVLGRLEQGRPSVGWARMAIEHGYADQAHMIREFKQITGTTPERYLQEQTDLAACFVP